MARKNKQHKYIFDDDTVEFNGITLKRLRALKNFSDVQKGDLGGCISDKGCLSDEGNCWVYDGGVVLKGAKVISNAKVLGGVIKNGATIQGNAIIHSGTIIGIPIGKKCNVIVGGNTELCRNTFIKGNVHLLGDIYVSGGVRLIAETGFQIWHGKAHIENRFYNPQIKNTQKLVISGAFNLRKEDKFNNIKLIS